MSREYLTVALMDSDEGNHAHFKDIFQDLKIGSQVRSFFSGTALMKDLSRNDFPVPDIVFMNYDMPETDILALLDEIRSDERYDALAVAVYAEQILPPEEEEIFVRGANVFMRRPAQHRHLQKLLSEIMAVAWQYYTCGLNRDHFIMKV